MGSTSAIVATMVAALHENGFDLPVSRTDVYAKRFDLLLDRWDRVRGVAVRNRVLSRDKMTFLQRLALDLHSRHQRRFTRQHAAETWQAGFARHYPTVRIDEMLWELQVCNSVVFAEGEDNFSLGHLSYQEYLAARAVVHAQNPKLLSNRFYDPYWRQVVIFYAGISGDVTRLLEMVQRARPLANKDHLLDELMSEARFTPSEVRAFIGEDEFDSIMDEDSDLFEDQSDSQAEDDGLGQRANDSDGDQ